ncbi:hypothetical protein GP486_000370 [Trichoglossum hirsutum]|uniref:Peroxisomal-coenzyme A synthetase n=1 Tax=Trichoglossum hirsutum TaxID=265104 RepID=A0A9P8RU33_9PEZI|nr:hypothetical protein GP486_000370 [Trichoglossum hirsutum]
MATLPDSFQTAESPAIIIPSKTRALTLSYKQLAFHISSFQKKLAGIGVAPHSAISISLPNSLEFIVAFLATTFQRAIAAPLNPSYKQEEFEFYIGDLKSTVIIVPRGAVESNGPAVRAARRYQAAIAECYWDDRRDELILDVKDRGALRNMKKQSLQRARPDDIALILHTSGTTGRPKAVPLTHRNLTRTMKNISETYKLTPQDRTLLVMPLFHVHGLLAAFLSPLFSGGCVIVPKRFSASEFWHDFTKYRANWYTAVPTIHQILLKTPPPDPKPDIRFIRSCSSPLSPSTFHKLEEAFDAPVLEAYAMTEAAHQLTSNPLPPSRRKPGSVGVGQGVEVKILDGNGEEVRTGFEGEICIRGENVTRGYLNNPEANKSSFTKSGFFRTGDQGKQDEDGYLVITGRIKELINKGGEKISPVELDNILMQHPAVSEAVSFAVADEIYGQEVGVAVVLRHGKALRENELRTWMAERVAEFKLPKKIYFVNDMPKTATGKIQRKMVAEAISRQDVPKANL